MAGQVPSVTPQLVLDPINEPPRPKKPHPFVSSYEKPQDLVEPDEVVNVRVRDEDVVQAVYFLWRQRMKIPQIEEERPFLEEELDIDGGVPEAVVDEEGM